MNLKHSLRRDRSVLRRRDALLRRACDRIHRPTPHRRLQGWIQPLEERRLLTAWTVMVYLDADNNLESAGIADFEEMASVTNTDVNIVVQMDRASGYNTSNGDWTSTKRFLVTHGKTPTAANQLSDIGETNTGDPNTLSSFVNWGRTAYPADHYALILWDHGGGWRGGTCNDDSSGDVLSLGEVYQALDTATNGGANPIDVVGMDACLMAQLETAYTIKDYSSYFVGSAETEPGDGWEYNNILRPADLSATTTPQSWARTIVDEYANRYDGDNSNGTLMTARSANVDLVATRVSNFASALTSNMATERGNIQAAWNAARKYTDNTGYDFSGFNDPFNKYVDLNNFANQIYQRSTNPAVTGPALLVQQSVYDMLDGGHYWNDADYSGTTTGEMSFSIYFPDSAADPSFDSYDGTHLYLLADRPGYTQQWDEFLRAYFYGDPPASITPGAGSWVHLNEAGHYAVNAQIGSETEVDLYGFVPQTSGTYQFGTTGSLDSQLRIYNQSGSQLTGVVNATTGGENTSLGLTAGSWYYVGVAGTKLAKGAYTMSITGPEQGHTPLATPAPTYTGSTSGSLTAGDTDFYELAVPAGMHRLSVNVSPTSGLDTVVLFYDAAGTGLGAFNFAGAGSPDQVNNLLVTDSSAVYVAVVANDRAQTGSYSLSATFSTGLLSDPDDQLSEAVDLPAAPPSAVYTNDIDIATDVDLYRIVVTAGQHLAFDIDSAPSGGLGDSYLRLFDASGAQVAYNDDGSGGVDSYLDWTFTTGGTYYIGISGWSNTSYNPVTGSGDVNGATGLYALKISVVDPDDQISEAKALGSAPPRRTATSAIDQSGDVDFYSFTVTAGRRISFDVDAGTLSDSVIRLFNSGGSQLAMNDDAPAPGEYAYTLESFLTYTFTTGGTYYLGVSGYGNADYDPDFGGPDAASDVGTYVLTIDEADWDDQIAEATPIANILTTRTVSDSIQDEKDVDMFAFTVPAGMRVTIDLDREVIDGLTDSYLRLFDASGTVIDLNDDGWAPDESPTSDSYLDHVFKNAGTYYVGVSGFPNYAYDAITGEGDYPFPGTATGAYALTITGFPDVAPPVVAAPPVVTGGRQVTPDPSVIKVSFSEDVGDSLSLADVYVFNMTTGAEMLPSKMALAFNPATREATITFPGLSNAALPDGRYRLTLAAAGITDYVGHALDGDANGTPGGDYRFYFNLYTGDATGDGAIDFNDLVVLAQNYGRTGGMTVQQGDFTGDHNVDFNDLVLMAQGYGTSLPPPPLPAPAAAPASAANVSARSKSTAVAGAQKALLSSRPRTVSRSNAAPHWPFATARIRTTLPRRTG